MKDNQKTHTSLTLKHLMDAAETVDKFQEAQKRIMDEKMHIVRRALAFHSVNEDVPGEFKERVKMILVSGKGTEVLMIDETPVVTFKPLDFSDMGAHIDYVEHYEHGQLLSSVIIPKK